MNLWRCSRTGRPPALAVAVLVMSSLVTCLASCTCPRLNAFAGRIVDQYDRPVAGVELNSPALRLRSLGPVTTDADGRYGWPAAEGRAAGEQCAEDEPEAQVGQVRSYGGDRPGAICVAPPGASYTVAEAGTTKFWCCPRALDLSVRGKVVDDQGLGLGGARVSIQVTLYFYERNGLQEAVVLRGDSSDDGAFDLRVESTSGVRAERLVVGGAACGGDTLQVSRAGCEPASKAVAFGWEPTVEVGTITLRCSGP